jgi:flavin reductase (DIM6/NTAB) family NADH-FMN oxidoreductase RutF
LVHDYVAPRGPKSLISVKPTTPDDYHGMTISSFTTITLTPDPIISFNVKVPSQTLSTLSHTKQFLLHILEANEEGARVADAFTRGSKEARKVLHGGFRGLEIGQVGVKRTEIKFDAPELVLPLLRGGGVSRVLRCEVLSKKEGKPGLIRLGDHILVIARVIEVLGREGGEQEEGGERRSGLCYADGTYRRVGDIIEIKEDEVNGRRNEEDM